ncbi:MAG: class I SAM-dependent methyltransferase [Burkholderiales bacterium]|nr:class I SAM-dependent methyltransferase [Anaerolineae bacterium]
MPEHRDVYNYHAAEYDRLVMREDYQGNILRALREIRPLDGVDVVEFGAGTGRLTLLLAPIVRSIVATDISAHMLGVAADKLRQTAKRDWSLVVADNMRFPMRATVADISITSWSFGHSTVWDVEAWRADIGQAIGEMCRVLRPGGTAIILETLGTGSEMPHPPSETLAAYYTWLENEHGFSRMWIRTDYRFASLEEADELTRFFFGDEMADRVMVENLIILPECTGIWWLTV